MAVLEAFFSATWGTTDAANDAAARANADNPEKELAALISTATGSVDAAVAELSEPGLVSALVAAKARGVTVRIVTDSDSWESPQDSALPAPPFKTLQDAGISVVHDQRSAIMHDKFVVVDGRDVWTGSFNLTENAAFKQNNNAVRIASTAIAANFEAEFEEMFVTRKFGVTSPAGVPNPEVTLGAARVETLFAPEDKVGNRLVAQIRAASRSIRFMAFSFTHDAIGQAMMEAASAGVDVAGIIEKTNANGTGGEYPKLKAAGLDVRLDGNPSFMHHKVIVLDADTVITGSFNFSASADGTNDENVVIVRGAPDLAARYLAEYDRVRAVAAAN